MNKAITLALASAAALTVLSGCAGGKNKVNTNYIARDVSTLYMAANDEGDEEFEDDEDEVAEGRAAQRRSRRRSRNRRDRNQTWKGDQDQSEEDADGD